jgi:putative sterol carrier protein
MKNIPNSELERFKTIVNGQAQKFDLTSKEYLQKIWYHEEAAKLGEYMAMSLLDQLLQLTPSDL